MKIPPKLANVAGRIWKTITKVFRLNYTRLLAFLGVIAILISVHKVAFPSVSIRIVSQYGTVDTNEKGLFILKLYTVSNVDLVIDKISVSAKLYDGRSFELVPHSFRWKGVLFKMPDLKNREADHRLLKPLEPDLRLCGIPRGGNECYISMRSRDNWSDQPIISWSFKLKYRPHLLPIPSLPWLSTKTITVNEPETKDLYYDDSLFEKISAEERQKRIDEL